jgi:hypothetical protein
LGHQGAKGSEGIKGMKTEKKSTIKLSINFFFKCRCEVKLGFEGKISNKKDLELWRGSRVGKLKK